MIPQSFDYSAPTSLSEAIALLQQHGDEAKIMSGGHSLLPMMKLRLATPGHIIDIMNIEGLDYIKEDDGNICIGALATERDLENSDLIKERLPIIVDACKLIADPQVRNRATIGGNLAHGDSANDHPAVMLALGASVVATGPDGSRTIPVTDFFHGFYMTALQPEEIVTEIRIPSPGQNSSGAYHKIERKVGDYATAGIAIQLTTDGAGNCTDVGIGLTNLGPAPIKATRAEDALKGGPLTEDRIATAAQYASEDCSPSDDLRGSAEYKRHLVKVLVKRMVQKASSRI